METVPWPVHNKSETLEDRLFYFINFCQSSWQSATTACANYCGPFFTLPTMIHNRRQTTTPGTTCPTLSDKCVGSFTSHRIINIEGSSKNCERELACGVRAGTCSGIVKSISGGEVSGKPDGTLSPPMSGGATEPASTSLAIVGNPGLLVRSSG